MTIRIIEKPEFVDSIGGDNPRQVYHFKVIGTQSASTAEAYASNHFGPFVSTIDGILFRGEPSSRAVAYNHFDVDLEYIARKKDIGTWEWDFDGAGGTEHVTHCLEDEVGYALSGTAPSQNRVIGKDKNGNITGVDVPAQAGTLVINFHHPAGVFSLPYLKYLNSLANYVNSDPWLVWAAGEARFRHVRGRGGSDYKSSASYTFEISPNKSNFVVGGVTVTTKQGWDVAWTIDEPVEETVGSDLHPAVETKYVYVGKVSPRISFASAFGIS